MTGDYGVFLRHLAEERAAGHGNDIKQWWMHGEGASKWATWTELYDHLKHHMPDGKAKRIAGEWFKERYGFAAGSDKNRVVHGKPPRGKVVGPG